jgi:hypothetical protein
MSNLSKIKTVIKDNNILKKSLTDLQIIWKYGEGTNDIYLYYEKMLVNHTALFKWQENSYELIADSKTWQDKKTLFALLDKN